MFDTGTIKINKNELKKILEEYYRKVTNDQTITVHFETKFQHTGPKNEEVPVVKITLKRIVKIGSYEVTLEETLNEPEINEAISSCLESEEYKIDSSYQNIEASYGNSREGTSDKITYSGITVLLTRKGIKKSLKEVNNGRKNNNEN